MVTSKNEVNSVSLETNLGVPQGSVLGPLLFCLYVNDLQDILGLTTVKHIIYADDLEIYGHTTKNKILEGIVQLTDVAKLVSDWAGGWPSPQARKTKAILFNSKMGNGVRRDVHINPFRKRLGWPRSDSKTVVCCIINVKDFPNKRAKLSSGTIFRV